MSEPRYIAGYGHTKHILNPNYPHSEKMNDGFGLCGAPGGYPLLADHRPVCKRCQKQQDLRDRDFRRAVRGAL